MVSSQKYNYGTYKCKGCQRVVDKINWAIEFLKQYGYYVGTEESVKNNYPKY